MTSTKAFSERIDLLRKAIAEADSILIGAGSGLSTAAGLDYAGADFKREFATEIERYGFTDLYSAGFYPYPTPEEFWAHWVKHIWFCRYRIGALPLYRQLHRLFPNAFVVTTNVDAQFAKAGFPADSTFATQGDYGYFQPASGSPKTLVSNHEWVERTLPLIQDCRIPTENIPTMPDGSPAAVNLRSDDTFVEDFRWHQQSRRYTTFVEEAAQGRLLLLEFGIGYNTPGIIRLPFEQMAQRFPHTTLVRFNRDHPEPYIQDIPHFISFTEDIEYVLNSL
ncbi:MAG: Sir2 silent information regulator family NAD-dependent deacetylase [Bacteroidales bacterium]|nr:Sir2 silent information regulator family NAD-dependent deacetylase [Bacteroidales bacterium]